jgi:tetratricopeptide (TPR) repeat protein
LTLSHIAFEQRDYAEAKQQAHQSLLAAEALDYRRGILNAHFNLADIAYAVGDYPEADKHYQRTYAMSCNFGNRLWIAQALCGLGRVACVFESYRDSRQHFCEALRLARMSQSVPTSLESVEGLAELLSKMGEKRRAVELLAVVLNSSPVWPIDRFSVAQAIQERSSRLSDSLRAELDADIYAAMWQQGKALELDAVAATLLNEMPTE